MLVSVKFLHCASSIRPGQFSCHASSSHVQSLPTLHSWKMNVGLWQMRASIHTKVSAEREKLRHRNDLAVGRRRSGEVRSNSSLRSSIENTCSTLGQSVKKKTILAGPLQISAPLRIGLDEKLIAAVLLTVRLELLLGMYDFFVPDKHMWSAIFNSMWLPIQKHPLKLGTVGTRWLSGRYVTWGILTAHQPRFCQVDRVKISLPVTLK